MMPLDPLPHMLEDLPTNTAILGAVVAVETVVVAAAAAG